MELTRGSSEPGRWVRIVIRISDMGEAAKGRMGRDVVVDPLGFYEASGITQAVLEKQATRPIQRPYSSLTLEHYSLRDTRSPARQSDLLEKDR